jgi:hypothetical protein
VSGSRFRACAAADAGAADAAEQMAGPRGIAFLKGLKLVCTRFFQTDGEALWTAPALELKLQLAVS